MVDDLEARLQSHAKAFEGLMSLLPPDLYYGKQDTENEWMKKKQTKEEKKAARKAKLNPANHKTAADVANERDKKRRLEDEEAERAAAGLDGPIERPGEGMGKPKAKAQKTAKNQDVHSKSKKDESTVSAPNDADSKEERRKGKELRRKEKQARKATKTEKKKQSKVQTKAPAAGSSTAQEAEVEDGEENEEDGEDELDAHAADTGADADIDAIDVSGLVDEPLENGRRSSSRSASPDPEFSPHHDDDRASSTSSIPTPEDASKPSKLSKRKQPASRSDHALTEDEQHETPEQAKARKDAQIAKLHALIEAKRKARNADGLDGKPARSRSELIEARRQKQQELKEKKKTLRAQEREKLKKEEFEAHLASLRGSPALGSELFAPRSRSASVSSPGVANNNFSFSRVAFADGARLNSSLSGVDERKAKKGPQDAKTALLAAEKHQARLNGLDATKRADLEEKDMWLHARQRIGGEKPRDDVSLLKKSVKRKEKAKSRSEKQWNERLEGVKKSVEARQKKREENIAKRKEEKGGSKGKKGAKTGAGVKKKKRAGFEGTFRGRA